MTADHEPRNPADATPAEAALDERLSAIADTHSPRPRWDDVVDRAEGAPVVPIRAATAGKPFTKRGLAIAAALLVGGGAGGT